MHKRLAPISELFQLPRFFCSLHGNRLEDPSRDARLAKLWDIKLASKILTGDNFDEFNKMLHIDYRPHSHWGIQSFKSHLRAELKLRISDESSLKKVMIWNLERCRAKLKEMLQGEDAEWAARSAEIAVYVPPQSDNTPKNPAAKKGDMTPTRQKWETDHPSLHPSGCLDCCQNSKGVEKCKACNRWKDWSGYFACYGCKGRYCGDERDCRIHVSCSYCPNIACGCCTRKCMVKSVTDDIISCRVCWKARLEVGAKRKRDGYE